MVALALLASSVAQPVLADPGATGNRPRIALVLGGGGARGFAHVGVIRALEQEKIPIDLIVGTSIGSLIGALYAHEMNSFDLEWAAYSLDHDDLLGDAPPFKKGDRLEAFVKKAIPVVNIEDLKIPFAAVASDYKRSTRVVLERGSLARAIRASCSFYVPFVPVAHQGRLLVDGGIVDNLPVSVAYDKGADIVIAVNIDQNASITGLVTDLVTMPGLVGLRVVDKTFSKNGWSRRQKADVLISPAVGNVGMKDFTQKKRLIQAGVHAGQRAAPTIRQAIEAWNTKHDKARMLTAAAESAADVAPETQDVGMSTAALYQPEFEIGDSETKRSKEAVSPYTRISDAKKAYKEKKLGKDEYKKIVNRLEDSMGKEIDQAKTDYKADKIGKKEYKTRVEAIERKYK